MTAKRGGNGRKRAAATVAVAAVAFGFLHSSGGVAQAADLPAKAAPPAAPPPFFLFSDTVLEYRFEASATDPGFSTKFPKQIANITHVDAFQYGTNFISVDVLNSTHADPIGGANANGGPGSLPGNQQFTGYGSRELYAIYRGTVSGNAVTKSKAFAFGKIIKDVSLEYGTDLEVQNTAFAPQKTALIGGINIAFNVQGLLNLGIHAYKEWNHDGIDNAFGAPSNPNYDAFTGDQYFNTTAEFELVYVQPLKDYVKLPLTFNGFANLILRKGQLGNGANSQPEVLTSNRLTLDAGSFFGHPKLLDIFVGHKFWYNKFGNGATYGNPSYVPGSYENTFITGFDYHLQ